MTAQGLQKPEWGSEGDQAGFRSAGEMGQDKTERAAGGSG